MDWKGSKHHVPTHTHCIYIYCMYVHADGMDGEAAGRTEDLSCCSCDKGSSL